MVDRGEGPSAVLVEVTLGGPDASSRADVCSGDLWAAGAVAVEEQPGPSGSVILRTTTGDPAALEALLAAGERHGDVRTTEVPADAGLDAWRDHARPWRAGEHLVVWPAWLEHPGDHAELCRAGDVVITLDPGRAFGSGAHASTRLALAALEVTVRAGTDVLDVGCGSGVLSLAAAALGVRRVVAIDVDPEARAVTAENVRRAGLDPIVAVEDRPLEEVGGTFEVVVANVLAVTLRQLGPALAARVAPGGRLVLAGLLDEQVDGVVAAVPGLTPIERSGLDGWAGLVLG